MYDDNDNELEPEMISDEEFEEFIEMCKIEANRPKHMIERLTSKEKLKLILSHIKKIFAEEFNTKYTITTEFDDLFPTELTIEVESDFFETNMRDHNLFQSIINITDNFSVHPLVNNKLHMSFSIRDYFIET